MASHLQRSRQMTADTATERALPEILGAIERRNEEQIRDLAELREKLAAIVTAKQEITAHLGEAEHELAETRAALEIEKTVRERVEMRNTKLEAAMAAARATLNVATMEAAPADCGEDRPVATTEHPVAGNVIDDGVPTILDVGQSSDAATDPVLSAIVEEMERRSEVQSRDLAVLVEKLAAVTAEREAIAARLGETERELAEVRTALGRERQTRKEVEVRGSTLEGAIARARAALDLVAAAAVPADPARTAG